MSLNCENRIKKCFVPLCLSNSRRNPDKLFIFVPRNEIIRKRWFAAAHRVDEPNLSTNYYCCQDHFDLKHDMENYVQYCLWGGPKTIKSHVIPHLFDCQPDRPAATVGPCSGFVESNQNRIEEQTLTEDKSTRQKCDKSKVQDKDNSFCNEACLTENVHDLIGLDVPISNLNHATTQVRVPLQDLDVNAYHSRNPASICEKMIITEGTLQSLDENSTSCVTKATSLSRNANNFRHKQTQCKIRSPKHVRSKAVECNLVKKCQLHASTNTDNQVTDVACSPIWRWPDSSTSSTLTSGEKTGSFPVSSDTEYKMSDLDDMIAKDESEFKREQRIITNYNIANDPMFYLRIPPDWLWILDEISLEMSVPQDYLKLTLMKIKLDDQFKRLGDQFGYGPSHAGRIFNITLPKLYGSLKYLIYVPTADQVKKLLPIPFRTNFSKVYGIIDCFEIQIEKPSNPLHQALTWSEYKKCNTLKYLLCITPDGLQIFISKGYGGRVSDMELFGDCGIMDILPENSMLMTDRGFKGIDTILRTKNIELVRPPTVPENYKPTKQEVILTKRIASVRIHVERAVRRIREFKLLTPHSTLHHAIIPQVDMIIQIAGGLINLQQPLIKT